MDRFNTVVPQRIDLPRRRPDPVPAIHTVPEYLAEPDLRELYEDTKAVLRVPWMGVVTMAYAHYREFYKILWTGLKPLCAGVPFVETSNRLRRFVEEEVATLDPPPIAARLAAAGYASREVDDIRALIEVFSSGNFPYLLFATITRCLLEGAEIGVPGGASPAVTAHEPRTQAPLVLMEPHHVDAPTRSIYEDVKTTLELPFVNTDYRALARWPSYFAIAWHDLKQAAVSPVHEALAQAVHDRAVDAVRTLPNPRGVISSAIREAAATDASVDEVLQMSRLFQWLLPGLVINVAYFRHQLLTP